MVLFAATLPPGSNGPEGGEWLAEDGARAAVPSVMRRLLDLGGAAPAPAVG
jgi:A/G-specific adenine glycosylase